MALPDESYVGRVYIVADTVDDEQSLDYGHKKFVIELTVLEGKYKDEVICFDRLLLPHYLADMPVSTEREALTVWRDAAKNYLRQTNQILGKCGVDILEVDSTRLVMSIGESNVRKPIVNFTVKNGLPEINRFMKFENNDKYLSKNLRLPDGNDLPL